MSQRDAQSAYQQAVCLGRDGSNVVDAVRLGRARSALLEWFRTEGSDLPWRRAPSPYHVLVSEFMLQQTQRDRVIPKYIDFIERFPTLASLAAAPASAVIRAWAGLGYNSRAIRLHAIARTVVQEGGKIPADVDRLRALPGIGEYTAAAVACFGFGQQVAMVDTNVRRVLVRLLLGEPFPNAEPKRDALLARNALPPDEAFAWNSALMDLGARLCVARGPRCSPCPLRDLCLARRTFEDEGKDAGLGRGRGRIAAESRAHYGAGADAMPDRTRAPFAASDRFVRGRIVAALRGIPEDGELDLAALAFAATGQGLPGDEPRVGRLAERLVRDGLLAVREVGGTRYYRLPE